MPRVNPFEILQDLVNKYDIPESFRKDFTNILANTSENQVSAVFHIFIELSRYLTQRIDTVQVGGLSASQIISLIEGETGPDRLDASAIKNLPAATGSIPQQSVLDKDLVTPPGSPSTGDRYIVAGGGGTATGLWTVQENKIAEWDGSSWQFTDPQAGMLVIVEDEGTNGRYYGYTGTAWVSLGSVINFGVHSVTELNDVTSAGSGIIITAAERTALQSSFSAVAISLATITFTQNDVTTERIDVPVGVLALPDIEVTSSINITSANISTYANRTLKSRALAAINITMGAINTFSEDFFITIINESDQACNLIVDSTNLVAGSTSISILRGNSVTIKNPRVGTVWDVISDTQNTGQIPPTPGVNPLADGTVVLQPSAWDPTGGEFPGGSVNKGFLYQISAAGTVDGVNFRTSELLLALIDSPNTSIFAGNWLKIGDDGVHSWGGLTGIIDDNEIIAKLDRLGYERISPSVHNFSIDIPSRVDIGTDLNVSHVVTYDVSNRNSLTAVELIVTGGDNKTLTLPTRDGIQTETIILTGINSSIASSVIFTVRGTDTNSVTHDSNSYTVTIANLTAPQQTHFGFVQSTQDQTNIVFGTGPGDPTSTDTEVRGQADGNWVVSDIPADSNTYRIYWAVPTSIGSITRVTQGGFTLFDSALSSGNQFTAVSNVTIDSETYNVLLMNAGSAVNSNYNGTTLTTS